MVAKERRLSMVTKWSECVPNTPSEVQIKRCMQALPQSGTPEDPPPSLPFHFVFATRHLSVHSPTTREMTWLDSFQEETSPLFYKICDPVVPTLHQMIDNQLGS